MPPTALALLGDVGDVLRTVGALLGLGLVMAFSPTTFGIEVGAIERGRRPGQRVLIIAGAVALAASVFAALFLVISPGALSSWTGEARGIIRNRWLELVVGVVLVAAGLVQWRRAARPRTHRRSADALDRPRVLFSVVLAESMISTTGPATMYLVVRVLDTTRPVLWPLDYAVFLIGLAAPYVFVAVAITTFPPAARHATWLVGVLGRRDLRRPLAVVAAVAGAGLIIWAATRLLPAG